MRLTSNTNRLIPRSTHMWLPWMLVATLALSGEAIGWHFFLPSVEVDLVRCTVASTAITLLAIKQHWSNERRPFELVVLGVLLLAAWVAGRTLNWEGRLLSLVAVCLAVPSYSAWRFAADMGQSGFAWSLRVGLRRGALILAAAAVAVLTLPGCAPKQEAPKPSATATYDLRGVVVTVNSAKRSLVVHHEEIKGYMPSMTMEFPVPDADFSSFKEGQTIAARMVVEPNGDLHLEGIRVVDAVKERILASSAASLQQDTITRGKGVFREVGEKVPQFTLLDQDNNVVSIDRFRGKRVILDFIYTRCPVASMCPASTAKMMQIQAAAKMNGIKNIELISITLDPSYDTPAVLKNYASMRGIDTSNFTFLTGPETAVRDLLLAFGILVKRDDNLLRHTLATVLINEKGTILYRADGSGWTAKEFLDKL